MPLDAAPYARFDWPLHRVASEHVVQRRSDVLTCRTFKMMSAAHSRPHSQHMSELCNLNQQPCCCIGETRMRTSYWDAVAGSRAVELAVVLQLQIPAQVKRG